MISPPSDNGSLAFDFTDSEFDDDWTIADGRVSAGFSAHPILATPLVTTRATQNIVLTFIFFSLDFCL
jgi:hypothetical protein